MWLHWGQVQLGLGIYRCSIFVQIWKKKIGEQFWDVWFSVGLDGVVLLLRVGKVNDGWAGLLHLATQQVENI